MNKKLKKRTFYSLFWPVYIVFSVIFGIILSIVNIRQIEHRFIDAEAKREVVNSFTADRAGIVITAVSGAVVFLIIPFLLAFFITDRRYTKYRIDHDIFTYRSNLTKMLAADLKKPLEVIKGHAGEIKAGVGEGTKLILTGEIQRQVRQMDRLIKDIMELEKTDGATAKNKTVLSMRELYTEAYGQVKDAFAQKNVTLKGDGDATVKADRSMMIILLTRLLENGLEYADENETVTVSIAQGRLTVITPCHAPESIDPEGLKTPFAGEGMNKENGKTGLDIAIAKSICDMHRFELEISVKKDLLTNKDLLEVNIFF